MSSQGLQQKTSSRAPLLSLKLLFLFLFLLLYLFLLLLLLKLLSAITIFLFSLSCSFLGGTQQRRGDSAHDQAEGSGTFSLINPIFFASAHSSNGTAFPQSATLLFTCSGFLHPKATISTQVGKRAKFSANWGRVSLRKS